MGVIFITGIDAESGKSIATGLLGRYLLKQGKTVITQKLVQTGCEGISSDIELHRKLMGINLTEDDHNGLTSPYIFKYPSAPALAAEIENKSIDLDVIAESTQKLSEKYDYVLIEGSGGVLVPLTNDIMQLDYIEMNKYPVIVISNTKIGSINHTLLTFDAVLKRDLDVLGLIYDQYPNQEEEIIQYTKNVLERYISQWWFDASIVEIPPVFIDSIPDIDFSTIF